MAFADGWVCRACWKPNRQRDERCYVCKVPRRAEAAVVEVERKVRKAARERPPAEPAPDWLVALPVIVFSGWGWVLRMFSLLSVVLAFPAMALSPYLGGALLVGALFQYPIGMLYRALANGMRNRSAWAFIVGFVVAGPPSFYAAIMMAAILGSAAWARLPQSLEGIATFAILIICVEIVAFGSAAVCALLGLVLSIVRPAIRAVAGAPHPTA